MNIGREKQPHQLFKDYVSLKPRAVSSKRAIPESPIYCPRGDFFTIVRSKFCTEQMYELLCDMRDLTDLFFQSFLDPDYNDKSDTVPQISCQPPPKPCDLQTAAEACLKHIETLSPLAIMSGTPMSYAAWMFEVVRVISLIYTTAIAKGIPFSKAAIIINARCEHTPIATTPGMLPSSLHSLVTALQKSNASESWGDMSGVLYWCLMVGGAATRKRGDPADWTDDDEWARRYLAATGVRLSILLCFEHAEPTTVSLRRLNKVQELLSRKRIADSPVTENVFEAINREMVEC